MTETPGSTAELPWWQDRTNLVLLTRYMAEHGSTADEVAYAVEKPWKHGDMFLMATKMQEEADG